MNSNNSLYDINRDLRSALDKLFPNDTKEVVCSMKTVYFLPVVYGEVQHTRAIYKKLMAKTL